MSLTPWAMSLSRNDCTPLSKAGLLLSPAISTARQRPAGTAPLAGAVAIDVPLVVGGAVPVGSDVQAAASRKARTSAARRPNMSGYSNTLG